MDLVRFGFHRESMFQHGDLYSCTGRKLVSRFGLLPEADFCEILNIKYKTCWAGAYQQVSGSI